MSQTCRLDDVQLGPSDVLGAALLAPGFCEDLTTWRLTIDESGQITQEIFLYCGPLYRSERLIRTSQLTQQQLEQLFQLAEEVDFAGLQDEYDPGTDDAETTDIVLKTSSGAKRVVASDAFHAAHLDGDADMQRYVRLWQAIVAHAPTNSPAWRQEREQAQREDEVELLKRRVREKDFVVPSVKEVIAAVIGFPAFVFAIQLFYPKFGQPLPELPTLREFLVFTGIGYTAVILVRVKEFYRRRQGRLAAEQELARYQSDAPIDH